MILSEVDKYNQMKEEIRGRQKQSTGLSEDENKRKQADTARERRSDGYSPYQVVGRAQAWQLNLNASFSRT